MSNPVANTRAARSPSPLSPRAMASTRESHGQMSHGSSSSSSENSSRELSPMLPRSRSASMGGHAKMDGGAPNQSAHVLSGPQPASMASQALGATTEIRQGHVAAVYQERRYFHGTSGNSAANIQKNGMQLQQKTAGATHVLEQGSVVVGPEAIERSARGHYWSRDFNEASHYSARQFTDANGNKIPYEMNQDGGPKIVRGLLFNTPLKQDQDSKAKSAFRTTQNTPAAFIKQSGRRNYSPEVHHAIAQEIEQTHGYRMSPAEAAKHLDEVASGSDDD
jgi:hypothetical protein